MDRIIRRLLLVLLMLALIALPLSAALAKGPPDQVGITGPGLDGEILITDPDLLNVFAIYQFNDLGRRTDAPTADLGEGYHITRYMRDNGRAGFIAWDSLTYYPREGAPGLIYYDGLNPTLHSRTEGQGEWYLAKPDGDAAMQQIIATYGPPAPLSIPPDAARGLTVAPIAALGGLLVAAAILARRSAGRVPA